MSGAPAARRSYVLRPGEGQVGGWRSSLRLRTTLVSSPRVAPAHQHVCVCPALACLAICPQLFWLFLIFYGMPAQLPRFKIPSECAYFTTNAPAGFCCVPGSAECSAYYQPGAPWHQTQRHGRRYWRPAGSGLGMHVLCWECMFCGLFLCPK